MKLQSWHSLVIALLLALQTGCVAAPAAGHHAVVDNASPKRILFVGNSYLYYNDSLHNHVRRIAEENGPLKPGDYQYKSATIGGARLSHHNIDSLLEPGRLGIDEPFDLVILQGGSAESLNDKNRAAFLATATAMSKKIRATKAEVALYMTHAYVPPHRLYDPAMIDKVEQNYVATGRALKAPVIPVGLAFKRAYQLRPDLALHTSFDGTHPNMLGTYLAACVVYASIYQRPVASIDYDYFGAIGKANARFLREVADETVQDFYKTEPAL